MQTTMTPFIQKTLQEFDEMFDEPAGLAATGEYSDPGFGPEQMKTFLITALEEALLKGLELAEGAVPGEDARAVDYDRSILSQSRRVLWGFYALGWNECLLESKDQIALLKKEVMEGRSKCCGEQEMARGTVIFDSWMTGRVRCTELPVWWRWHSSRTRIIYPR